MKNDKNVEDCKILQNLSLALFYNSKIDYTMFNQFKKLKKDRKEKIMTTVEPIRSINDFRKVEEVLKEQSDRNLLLFTIGTNCGLRISDILKLNVGDVRNISKS